MSECIFCKIVEGTVPCHKVYENAEVVAFLDIHPINRGHTLVVPKAHCENIFDISPKQLATTMNIAQKVAQALAKYSDGVNIGINNKTAAGQVVFHFHVHVIPRFEGDGLKHWPGKRYAKDEAAKIAGEIRKLL